MMARNLLLFIGWPLRLIMDKRRIICNITQYTILLNKTSFVRIIKILGEHVWWFFIPVIQPKLNSMQYVELNSMQYCNMFYFAALGIS